MYQNDRGTVVTDSAIQNAKARRDDLAAKINDLQTKIADYKKDLARVDQFISDWNAFAGVESEQESGLQGIEAKKANPSREEVADMAAVLIEKNCAPILRADLFRLIEDRGLHIHGKNPEMVLSTMMWRTQDKFVRIPGWGYWFRDRPFPPAKYQPGDIPDSRSKREDESQDELEKLI